MCCKINNEYFSVFACILDESIHADLHPQLVAHVLRLFPVALSDAEEGTNYIDQMITLAYRLQLAKLLLVWYH